jgi:hypothetical protein
MNKWSCLSCFLLFIFVACNNEESGSKDKAAYFPVLSFLQGQVAHIDSSVYSITQVTKNGNHTDTAYIKREDFKNTARDFLSIPDISSKKLRKKYNESRLYDETLGKVVITYTPKDEDMEILRQDVIIQPNPETGDQVETIYIERLLSNDDSTVQKKMTWQVDKGFQVRSIIQKKNSPEKIENMAVTWSNSRSAE